MSASHRTFIRSMLLGVLCLPFVCMGELKKGQALPNLDAFKLEGPLPKTRGQVVLLDFWASWCAPCKASFPEMEKLHKQYSPRGLTILAVNVDEQRENMERFLKLMQVSFPIVRDAHQKLVAAADVQTMPTSFVIDRSGKVRYIHDGFRGEQTVREYRARSKSFLRSQRRETDNAIASNHNLRDSRVSGAAGRMQHRQALAARRWRIRSCSPTAVPWPAPLEHVYFSREAANGAKTVGGAGCGCN